MKEKKNAQSSHNSDHKISNPSKKDFRYGFYTNKNFGSGGEGPLKSDKWLQFGLIGAVGLIGALMMMEGGKEITWREFVYR